MFARNKNWMQAKEGKEATFLDPFYCSYTLLHKLAIKNKVYGTVYVK